MDINEFMSNLASQFDEPENITLTSETKFHQLKEWDSLTALMTISMVDEIYGVTLPPEELKQMTTIQELFDFISTHHK